MFVNIRPTKGNGMIQKARKLRTRYMGTYPIIERVGRMAYRVPLLEELSQIHDVFHVS